MSVDSVSRRTQTQRTNKSSDTPTSAQAAAVKKMLDMARSEIGYHEGANNYNKFSPWNGLQNQPWCASFVSYMLQHAGLGQGILQGHGSASVNGLIDQFQAAGRYHPAAGYTPQPGDVVMFANGEHTGLVERVENGKVYTIEGNSSDQVARRCYNLGDSYITGYGNTVGEKLAGNAGGGPANLNVSTSTGGGGGGGSTGAVSSGGGATGSTGGATTASAPSGTSSADGTQSADSQNGPLSFGDMLQMLLSTLDQKSDDEAADDLQKMCPSLNRGQAKALAHALKNNPALAKAVKKNPELLKQLAKKPELINSLPSSSSSKDGLTQSIIQKALNTDGVSAAQPAGPVALPQDAGNPVPVANPNADNPLLSELAPQGFPRVITG